MDATITLKLNEILQNQEFFKRELKLQNEMLTRVIDYINPKQGIFKVKSLSDLSLVTKTLEAKWLVQAGNRKSLCLADMCTESFLNDCVYGQGYGKFDISEMVIFKNVYKVYYETLVEPPLDEHEIKSNITKELGTIKNRLRMRDKRLKTNINQNGEIVNKYGEIILSVTS